MVSSEIFTGSFKKNKKSKKWIIFAVFQKIVKKNPHLFFFNVFLAVITAIINFNIAFNFKEFFSSRKPDVPIFDQRYDFTFHFFGRWKSENLTFWTTILWLSVLILIGKGIFSLIHFYWMNYSYDKVENDLKKDLFKKFIEADYPNSSQVSGNLFTQFNFLDQISRNIWFISNRIFYVLTSISYFFIYDFFKREYKGADGKAIIYPDTSIFIYIILIIFFILFLVEFYLLKKATKLNIETKKRLEKENIHILERINNLEHIKTSSGENYEQRKLNNLLDRNFVKNKKSLLWSVLFQAVPSYLIIPNVNLLFILLSGTAAYLVSPPFKKNPVFSAFNFALIYQTVWNLKIEVEKIITSLVSLDDLSSDLTIIMDSINVLEKKNYLPVSHLTLYPFNNGDIIYEKAVFAYPTRPNNVILKDFSFRFIKGQSYGIAGKNGIGKSTITKTLLKLYNLQKGQIFVKKLNIQSIDTIDLRKHILYLTNRPGLFHMSIAENVVYPNKYEKEKDLPKLEKAAKQVGINEFIASLPKGFDTQLKERGGDLSEGQKQQIAMMRLFIYDHHEIYIFDEILTNVNPILKDKILTKIFQKTSDKTVIVIDHHYEIFQHVNNVYQFTGEELIKIEREDLLKNK